MIFKCDAADGFNSVHAPAHCHYKLAENRGHDQKAYNCHAWKLRHCLFTQRDLYLQSTDWRVVFIRQKDVYLYNNVE